MNVGLPQALERPLLPWLVLCSLRSSARCVLQPPWQPCLTTASSRCQFCAAVKSEETTLIFFFCGLLILLRITVQICSRSKFPPQDLPTVEGKERVISKVGEFGSNGDNIKKKGLNSGSWTPWASSWPSCGPFLAMKVSVRVYICRTSFAAGSMTNVCYFFHILFT